MPSASETMAMAVMKGVLKSMRMANLRLRIEALDEQRYGGVYRLGRNAWLRHERLPPRAIWGLDPDFRSRDCTQHLDHGGNFLFPVARVYRSLEQA